MKGDRRLEYWEIFYSSWYLYFVNQFYSHFISVFFDYGVLFEVEYINEVSSLRAQEHLIDGGKGILEVDEYGN